MYAVRLVYAAVRLFVQAFDVEGNGEVVSTKADNDDDDDNDVTAASDSTSVCSMTSQSCTTTNSKMPLTLAGYIQLTETFDFLFFYIVLAVY